MSYSIVNRFIRYAFITIITITFFSTLVYISQSEVKEWDESRNGINAYEMLLRGSLVVPYFEGEVDTWNAKPPLFHWCLMASYKLFGLSKFAMRLPSLLATIGFFIVFYRLMLYYVSKQAACLACIILLTCKAVLGDHIGLTADFDSLLLFFLVLSVYFAVHYIRHGNRSRLVWASISTGLAFWTKGVAGLILLPSMAFYLFLNRKRGDGKCLIKPKDVFMGLSTLIAFIMSWTIVSAMQLHYSETGMYGSKSQLETMWVHDVIQRLFINDSGQFANGNKWNFLFSAIETRMQLWGILFFVVLVWMISNKKTFFEEKEKDLLLLCSLVIFPLGILLSISKDQNNWYLAPVYPFVAVVTAVGVGKLIRFRVAVFGISLLILAQSIRQNYFLLTDRDEIPVSVGFEDKVRGKDVYYSQLPQGVLLKLVFMGAKPIKWRGDMSGTSDGTALWVKERFNDGTLLGTIGKYGLLY